MKKVNNKKNKISVRDFQNWVNGILEFQTNEWTPSKDQWKTILAKINLLEDAEVMIETVNDVAKNVKQLTKQHSTPNNNHYNNVGYTPPDEDDGSALLTEDQIRSIPHPQPRLFEAAPIAAHIDGPYVGDFR